MKYKNEPKRMTHHDYKEIWSFLSNSGLKESEISKTGSAAWRQAKDRGFEESEEWGRIPGGRDEDLDGWAESLDGIEVFDGHINQYLYFILISVITILLYILNCA